MLRILTECVASFFAELLSCCAVLIRGETYSCQRLQPGVRLESCPCRVNVSQS